MRGRIPVADTPLIANASSHLRAAVSSVQCLLDYVVNPPRRQFCAWVNPSPGVPAGGRVSAGRCGWRWNLDTLVAAASARTVAGLPLEADKVPLLLHFILGRTFGRTYVSMGAVACLPRYWRSVTSSAHLHDYAHYIVPHHKVTVASSWQEPADIWERAAQLRAMLSRIGASS